MAHQNGRQVTKPAPGDARNNGAPGFTPPPTKFANPLMAERDFVPSYGSNHSTMPSSLTPGQRTSSPLADDLKRKAAESDGGDLLQTIIERGTARDSANAELLSPQTRTLSPGNVPNHPSMKGASAGAKVPNKCG